MAEDTPIQPPLRAAVSEFTTPSPIVTFYTELVNRDDAAYVQNAPVKHGTLYSSMIGANPVVANQFPRLYFLRERKFQLSDQLVLWDWRTDEFAEDTYNAAVTYVANNVNYPAFTRVSTIRRADYDPSPTKQIGSLLTALLGVTIQDGGQNYTSARGTIPGKGVEIGFVIEDGQIISGVIENEGVGVVASDTIVVTGDGAGATIIPIVQGTNCYLTSQKKDELPPNDPLSNDFIQITRVYETLPGPFLATTRFDKDGAIVTLNTRRNITANITDDDTVADGVWTQTWHNASDSFVSEENVETRPIPGNPILSSKVEDDGNILDTVRYLEATTAIVSSEDIVGNVWIRKFGTEVDDSSLVKVHKASYKVSYQVIESRPVPGNFVDSTRFRSDGSIILVAKRLQKTVDITPGGNVSGGLLTLTKIGEIGDLVSEEIKEISLVPGPTIHGEHVDERNGIVIDIEKTVVPDGTEGGIIDGAYVEIRADDKYQSIQISSKLDPDSLPEDVVTYGGMQHSFPPELTDAIVDWAEAFCGCSDSFSSLLIANMKQYSGPVKTRVTEQFYNGPPPDDVTIAQFFPQSHNFGFAWSWFCGCTEDGAQSIRSGSSEYHIPLCLHDDLRLCIGNVGCTVYSNLWTFPATSPALLPHGDYIMLAPHVERWRFGVFRRLLTEVLVP